MLELNRRGLMDAAAWTDKNITLPGFDLEAMLEATEQAPQWVHFGAGNIFRGYVAALQQALLAQGDSETGIIAVEGFDPEILEKAYRPFDNLSLLVVMKGDGSFEKQVVASVAQGLAAVAGSDDWERLKEVFAAPSLQMASFTITEKGYALRDMNGGLYPAAARDLEAGPAAPSTLMGMAAALLHHRYQSGKTPIAMVSMDNCSHNGDKLKAAMLELARHWEQRSLAEAGFTAYLEDNSKVAFPLSMIDKITPGPAPVVQQLLESDGVAGMAPIVTAKNTRTAGFVNAEKAQYLVVEDRFPNGRPPLEKAGVYFTDRETVDRVEKMKVCTCLNPLHTGLAVFGCLLGYQSIAAEMADPQLKQLVERLGYTEGLRVVVDPGILSPREFLDEVMGERLPNPNVPDTPGRIAADTSQKVGIRYGETLKAYGARQDLDPTGLVAIPLTIAGWCRYLLGRDDTGADMPLSPDPMAEELQGCLAEIQPGGEATAEQIHGALAPILSNQKLFGVDLYALGLGEKIEGYFGEMLAGPGAVRAVLKRFL